MYARKNRDIKKGKAFFENVAQFKYLGTTVTNKISFRRKLRGDLIRVMPTTIQSRTVCLLVCSLKT
jgi:hypothetical protein